MLFYVTKLGKYDIMLGKPWLTDHNPNIDWTTNIVTFNSDHCRKHCMEKGQYQLTVPGASSLSISTATTALPRPSIPRRVGAAAFLTLAEKHDVDVFSLSLYEIDKRLAELGVIAEVSTFVEPKAPRSTPPLPTRKGWSESSNFKITTPPIHPRTDKPKVSGFPDKWLPRYTSQEHHSKIYAKRLNLKL